jgi:hypothetical protein
VSDVQFEDGVLGRRVAAVCFEHDIHGSEPVAVSVDNRNAEA